MPLPPRLSKACWKIKGAAKWAPVIRRVPGLFSTRRRKKKIARRLASYRNRGATGGMGNGALQATETRQETGALQVADTLQAAGGFTSRIQRSPAWAGPAYAICPESPR